MSADELLRAAECNLWWATMLFWASVVSCALLCVLMMAHVYVWWQQWKERRHDW